MSAGVMNIDRRSPPGRVDGPIPARPRGPARTIRPEPPATAVGRPRRARHLEVLLVLESAVGQVELRGVAPATSRARCRNVQQVDPVPCAGREPRLVARPDVQVDVASAPGPRVDDVAAAAARGSSTTTRPDSDTARPSRPCSGPGTSTAGPAAPSPAVDVPHRHPAGRHGLGHPQAVVHRRHRRRTPARPPGGRRRLSRSRVAAVYRSSRPAAIVQMSVEPVTSRRTPAGRPVVRTRGPRTPRPVRVAARSGAGRRSQLGPAEASTDGSAPASAAPVPGTGSRDSTLRHHQPVAAQRQTRARPGLPLARPVEPVSPIHGRGHRRSTSPDGGRPPGPGR